MVKISTNQGAIVVFFSDFKNKVLFCNYLNVLGFFCGAEALFLCRDCSSEFFLKQSLKLRHHSYFVILKLLFSPSIHFDKKNWKLIWINFGRFMNFHPLVSSFIPHFVKTSSFLSFLLLLVGCT